MSEDKATTKTAKSRKSLTTARSGWQFIQDDFREGHEHKKAGKPVVWSCALIEKEIYYALGIHPYYPEQFASLCAIRRKTPESDNDAIRFSRIAEQAGYSTDLCGYQRTAMGYVLNGDLSDAPLGGMAAPDLLITSSKVCDLRVKWWEDMAQRLNVPMFTIDKPERFFEGMLREPRPHEIRYYRSQLEDCIAFISEVTGQAYDPGRLNECLDLSYKTNELRLEIMQLCKAVPSPMSAADGFATMYPGMYCSGTEKAYQFYRTLRDELRERVETGRGQIENERFRLLILGMPLWFNMGLLNYFEPIGGAFAYQANYNATPWPSRNPDEPLLEIATRTLTEGTSLIRMMVTGTEELVREYQIDGVLISSIITCRPVYIPMLETRHMLETKLGVPSVQIECDLVDERSFSWGQVRTRLDAFAEQILHRKGLSEYPGSGKDAEK
ncbi:MAG: 2-hydroxyacyl-CoA dehydratase [Chloroflexi bacterium]|jgi:benzoyl-CoA reductase/2-hydroxyglutaryl-CoA dehydratase subunit BcrC/BadD/HgdB|nr:2-hydroxyacyl-CoA dehydratase [Chloroflexota bacterium]